MDEREKQELKAIDILAVASCLDVQVKGTKAMCVKGHDVKTPSLSFKSDNTYKCFGCGIRGDTINLVMDTLSMSFIEAAKWLQINFKGGATYTARPKPKEDAARPVNPFEHSHIYADFLSMCEPDAEELSRYWQGRGIGEHTIKRQRITYLSNPADVFRALTKKYNLDVLKGAGFLSSSGKFLFYAHKIIMPFYMDDKPVFLQGRREHEADNPQKYTMLSKPIPCLYNHDALKALRPNDTVYLTEGIPDTLSILDMDFRAVAALGVNNFKPLWVKLLFDFDLKVCGDNDTSGNAFNTAITQLFLDCGKVVKTIKIDQRAKDMNEHLINLQSQETF